MAEDTGGERTLPASPQKIQRAREEGNVPRSQDFAAGLALCAALLALYAAGPYAMRALIDAMRFYFASAHDLVPARMAHTAIAAQAIYVFAIAALPVALAMMAAGLALGFLQAGFLLTARPLMPQLNRINPLTGFQRFFSLRALAELVKSVLKLAAVAVVVYITLRDRREDFAALMELPAWGIVLGTAELTFALWWRIALLMALIGLADFGFQRWQFQRDQRMTVQEARQELKELEGDPMIKRRIRQIQRRIATQRMMAEVPRAEVVITNPTEYAVALRYDPAQMSAPIVVAKGTRLLAQRIRELAVEHDVPIVQRPELARTLYAAIDLGQSVPENLYRAVAEVLSFVFRIDRRIEKQRERERIVASG